MSRVFRFWMLFVGVVLLCLGGWVLLGGEVRGAEWLAVVLCVWGVCQVIGYLRWRGFAGRVLGEVALTVCVLGHAVAILVWGWMGFLSFVFGYFGSALVLCALAVVQGLTIWGMMVERLEVKGFVEREVC